VSATFIAERTHAKTALAAAAAPCCFGEGGAARDCLMPKPEPAFSTTDAQRLTTCLDGIADDASELRWAALDQLRYFCDGANAALLEAIGGKRFPTLAVLVELLDTAARLGGPIAVRKCVDVRQRVPVGLVVQLLECLLCNATSNLKPFLKMPNGIKNLVTTLSHYEDLIYDAEGPDILDRACNVLSYCTFYHPASAASIFIAADGVAVVTRMLNAAITHYTRTLARPGTALPSRPMPLSGSSAQWDSLTGNICELVSNVSSANSQAQKAFTQGGALRSLIDLVPLLTTTRSMTVAQGQPSLTFATEQVLLAAATLVWCTPQSQTMLLEAGTIVSALAPPRPHPPPRPNAPRAPPLVSSLSSFISALSSFISALSSFLAALSSFIAALSSFLFHLLLELPHLRPLPPPGRMPQVHRPVGRGERARKQQPGQWRGAPRSAPHPGHDRVAGVPSPRAQQPAREQADAVLGAPTC